MSEYGIHWNFYTTIFFVNFLLTFLRNAKHSFLIAAILMVGYDIGLNQFNLIEYIFFAPRTNLINGNREGLFSSVGYLAIMLCSMSIGRIMYK